VDACWSALDLSEGTVEPMATLHRLIIIAIPICILTKNKFHQTHFNSTSSVSLLRDSNLFNKRISIACIQFRQYLVNANLIGLICKRSIVLVDSLNELNPSEHTY
jgi:hypothetical protein